MADWKSKYVSQIAWEITTSQAPGSGTDSRVTVTVMRDDVAIMSLNIEPGETTRLDRASSVFYFWNVTGAYFDPCSPSAWIPDLPYPDAIEFAHDVVGHLTCRFEIHGADLWRKELIRCFVRYTEAIQVAGTDDTHVWVDHLNWTPIGDFEQDVELSENPHEGFKTWTLVF